jgi:hypothetical protein
MRFDAPNLLLTGSLSTLELPLGEGLGVRVFFTGKEVIATML